MADPGLNGRFAWYELLTTEPKAAEAFYTKVVGWGVKPFPGMKGPYTIWMRGERRVGGLMELPAQARAGGAPPSWTMYVAVPDADGTMARAKSLGAQERVPVTDIPSVGRFAVLGDPQGAVFAILEPSDPATYGPDTPPEPLEFSWRELATTDPVAAAAFYTALFGWEKGNASDMGPSMGLYQEFGRGGMPQGGIYLKPGEMPAPAHWLLYAKVEDIHVSAETAQKLGGTVLSGPMEIPGGDLICQLLDPQGAAFALHQVRS